MAASDGPVTKNLPSSVAEYTFFMRKVSLDRIFRRPLLASVSSPLVSGVSIRCGLCDGPCFSLSSTSFSSANRKMDVVRLNTKVLNPRKAENTNYSSRETSNVLTPPHKRSDIRKPSDDQWHESQWQRDRSRIDLQRKKGGKNLEPTSNKTSRFLIWAQVLPWSNACCNSSLLRPRLWTTSGTSCWGPPANGTRLLLTTMWRPLNCPSVSTPVDTSSFPETPGIVSASPKMNSEGATNMTENLQCRIESNQLSRTAVRGLFVARFVRLFFLSPSSSEVGAPTSNSDPDTSVRGNLGSMAWTTGSLERLYTKTQQPHEVILCSSARSITSPIEFIDWSAKKF